VSLPVLAAVTGEPWEAGLLAGLEGGLAGVSVVRRCVDLADLHAAAAARLGRAALVSSTLRRLDRTALSRLAAAGVAVVGVHAGDDAAAAAHLRGLGLRHLVTVESGPTGLVSAVHAAVSDLAEVADPGWSRSVAAAGPPPHPSLEPAPSDGTGTLVAVWGPAGAPGRTTVAVGLAAELAAAGVATLLADADVYGGAVGQVLGFLDEAPGLAAAARLANNGALDLPALAQQAVVASTHLRVLTGISRADRWPELRPVALEQVWDVARSLAAVTVVDCGFCLEQDEELAYDTMAPRRNGATLATLAAADRVLAVGAADPVGVQRLVRGLTDLREALPAVVPRVLLNRVRRSAVGRDPERQLRDAIERYAGVADVDLLPYDVAGVDASVLQARPLAAVAPDSPLRLALSRVAASIVDLPEPTGRRRRRAAARPT
jgi:MinD-like ATPase involved in chromosome partitioning or flagellar assembly